MLVGSRRRSALAFAFAKASVQSLTFMHLANPATDEPDSVHDVEREIRRRLHDYCRGIDRLDAELVASVYFADAIDDHEIGRAHV